MDIYSDGAYYYAHLTTILVDGNLDFYEETNYYTPWLPTFRPIKPYTANGQVGNFTQVGWALFCSPWFLLGRLISYLMHSNGIPVYLDGYDTPERTLAIFGSSVYGFLGVLLSYRLIRYFFPASISLWSALGVWQATGLTYYTFVQPSFSHAIAAFIVSLLAIHSYRRFVVSEPTPFDLIISGIIVGLAALLRLQMIFWAVVVIDRDILYQA